MFNLIKLNLRCRFYILIINRNFAFRYQLNLKIIHYI